MVSYIKIKKHGKLVSTDGNKQRYTLKDTTGRKNVYEVTFGGVRVRDIKKIKKNCKKSNLTIF